MGEEVVVVGGGGRGEEEEKVVVVGEHQIITCFILIDITFFLSCDVGRKNENGGVCLILVATTTRALTNISYLSFDV